MSKFDKIIPKGSVPNCQLQIANRYDNRWFKCKLKPPKNSSGRILFDTFVATYGPKFLIAYASHEFELFFLKNCHLTACETAKGSDTQNSKIGDLDHPMAHLYTDT